MEKNKNYLCGNHNVTGGDDEAARKKQYIDLYDARHPIYAGTAEPKRGNKKNWVSLMFLRVSPLSISRVRYVISSNFPRTYYKST